MSQIRSKVASFHKLGGAAWCFTSDSHAIFQSFQIRQINLSSKKSWSLHMIISWSVLRTFFSWLDLFSPDRWFAARWLVSASNCFGDRAVTGGSLVVVADAWSNLESALAPPPNVIQMDRAPVLLRPLKFHAKFEFSTDYSWLRLSQRLPPSVFKEGRLSLTLSTSYRRVAVSYFRGFVFILFSRRESFTHEGAEIIDSTVQKFWQLSPIIQNTVISAAFKASLFHGDGKNANLLIQTINKDACIDLLLLIGSSFDHLQLARKREERR